MNEKWISGYENKYSITSDGIIFSYDFHRQKIKRELKLKLDNTGYLRVGLRLNGTQKFYSVHRLVAQTFIENPNNLEQINHINGVKTDNYIENLEWCTQSENMIHAYKLGLQIPVKQNLHGSKNPNSIVTEDIVRSIRLNGKYDTYENIGKRYGLSKSAIASILKYKTWREV